MTSENSIINGDLSEAAKFLHLLTGEEDPICCFQTFSDSGVNQNLTKIFPNCRLSSIKDELIILNRKGAGIFVTINETDGKGRKVENVIKVRAYFADFDNVPVPANVLKPNMIVQSKRGKHLYYVIKLRNENGLADFTEIQSLISKRYNSDKLVKDLPRVMRLPGFNHMKNPLEPFKVHLIEMNQLEYSRDSILSYFKNNNIIEKLSKIPTQTAAEQAKSSSEIEMIFNSLPIEEGERNRNGGRNSTVMLFCRVALARGLTEQEIRPYLEKYSQKSGLGLEECNLVLNAQLRYHFVSPFEFRPSTEHEWATKFVNDFCKSNGMQTVFLKQEEYYLWAQGVYKVNSKKDFNYKIIKFLQTNVETPKILKTTFFNSVIKNVEAKLSTDNKSIENHILNSAFNNVKFISLKNGILLFPDDFPKRRLTLVEHSPIYFNLSKLDFDYNPECKCPLFDRILADILPSEELQNLIVDWFGYNVMSSLNFAKALFLIGNGANGKSVITAVLISLLGKENTTSVGLESFNGNRTFPLAATVGKLANIIEDSNEISKLAEGMLKSYVSAGQITVERKNKDPQTVTPTAKVTVATNSMPRFSDSTEGIYRRLLIVPFEKQILDPSKQDKRLNSIEFWTHSGEMSGVFNLAIVGLTRLLERGYFKEPTESQHYLREVRLDNNPAQLFLTTYCKINEVQKPLFSPELYAHYKEYCASFGYMAFGENKFAKQVKHVFPNATRSNSMILNPTIKKRQFYYIGIELNEEVVNVSEPFKGQF